jgi:hypothetical protein
MINQNCFKNIKHNGRDTLLKQKTYTTFDGRKSLKSLPELCLELLSVQKREWLDLWKGCESLKSVRERDLSCRGFSVRLQYNPLRIKSSTADVGNKNVKEQQCFLCLDHLPDAQKGILYRGDYLILCNPMPVLSPHFTISHLDHRRQAIDEHIDTLLQLMADFGSDWTVLFNGPKCGASAPDHLHFQAVPSGQIPIEKEIRGEKRLTLMKQADGVLLYRVRDLGREVIILEGDDPMAVGGTFKRFLNALKKVLLVPTARDHGLWPRENAPSCGRDVAPHGRGKEDHRLYTGGSINEEPMVNIAGFYEERKWEESKWRLLIFPRRKHRPDAFFREGDARVVVSPGVIDMGGVLITPVEKDFERLDEAAVEGIYKEVSLEGETVERAIDAMEVHHTGIME